MTEEQRMAERRREEGVQYGMLCQRVKDMDKKMDKMEGQIQELLELANKSKGGFWMGMTIASLAGGVVTWIIAHLGK